MSPEEREVVDGIETRWKEQYERFRNYPPMSEGQGHELAVFRATDNLHKALDARERAPVNEWKSLEVGVDRAFGNARNAFAEQREFVEREMRPVMCR